VYIKRSKKNFNLQTPILLKLRLNWRNWEKFLSKNRRTKKMEFIFKSSAFKSSTKDSSAKPSSCNSKTRTK